MSIIYKAFHVLTIIAISTIAALSVKADEVNVYTHRHYDSDKILFQQFTEKTGIKVNVVMAKADQLIKRLQAEGKNSPADVLITVDAGRLHMAKETGLLQAISNPEIEKAIPETLRDKQGYWVALTQRARVVAYNKSTVKANELSSYEDLANPKWKGRILVRSSSNTYNQSMVASFIAKWGEEKTSKWLKGFVSNFARAPKGNDRDQMRSVIAGEADLAIVNTYYLGKLAVGDEQDQAIAKQLAIHFPKSDTHGTHINVSGIGITSASKNKENAIKLISFLANSESQAVFANGNHEYPVSPNVKPSKLVQSWGSYTPDSIALEDIAKQHQKALLLMDKAGWK